jgi:hypothetical protein
MVTDLHARATPADGVRPLTAACYFVFSIKQAAVMPVKCLQQNSGPNLLPTFACNHQLKAFLLQTSDIVLRMPTSPRRDKTHIPPGRLSDSLSR